MSETQLVDSIRQLVLERDELTLQVRGGRKRGRSIREKFGKKLYNFNEVPLGGIGDQNHSSDLKRQKISEYLEQPLTEEKPAKISDATLVKRSRALFGNLLGHLKKAKQILEQESTTRQAECHKAQDERVEKKLIDQQRAIQESRRKEMEEKRKQQMERYEAIQKELATKETMLLRLQVERHYVTMMNFIRTRAEPTLFWLPNVHNKVTKKLQLETKVAIDNKIASLKDHLEITQPKITENDLQEEDEERGNEERSHMITGNETVEARDSFNTDGEVTMASTASPEEKRRNSENNQTKSGNEDSANITDDAQSTVLDQ